MIETRTQAASAVTALARCRLCDSEELVTVLDLGEHALTGVFPLTPEEPISRGPLELVWCPACALLQLAHTYDAGEMYGDNYGYRSGLNQSMAQHLARKANGLETLVRAAKPGDVGILPSLQTAFFEYLDTKTTLVLLLLQAAASMRAPVARMRSVPLTGRLDNEETIRQREGKRGTRFEV